MQKSKYTIFYTDDDPDDQDFFKEVVAEITPQHTIYTQNDGFELLEVLQNPPPSPHIIFLDLNMPKKSGYQVLKEIRETDSTKTIPVVIFSTSNDNNAIKKTKELGANMYITKPGSYTKFKKILNSVLALNWEQNLPADNEFVFTVN